MNSAPTPAVLVTGGGGRLGRLVVQSLRERGIRAVSLSRHAGGESADHLEVDLADADAAIHGLQGIAVDAIVHLASAVHSGDARAQGERADAGLESIIRRLGVQNVVVASSAAIYGTSGLMPLTETSPTIGTSPYALSKLATEARLQQLTRDIPSLSVTALRIFNIAGPSFPDSLVQRLLAADPAHPAQLMCPDSFVRDYVHQSDVLSALLASIPDRSGEFRVLNVGAGVPVSSRALVDSLQVSSECWVEVPGQESVSWCDNTALIEAFGFTPSSMPTRNWAREHLE